MYDIFYFSKKNVDEQKCSSICVKKNETKRFFSITHFCDWKFLLEVKFKKCVFANCYSLYKQKLLLFMIFKRNTLNKKKKLCFWKFFY